MSERGRVTVAGITQVLNTVTAILTGLIFIPRGYGWAFAVSMFIVTRVLLSIMYSVCNMEYILAERRHERRAIGVRAFVLWLVAYFLLIVLLPGVYPAIFNSLTIVLAVVYVVALAIPMVFLGLMLQRNWRLVSAETPSPYDYRKSLKALGWVIVSALIVFIDVGSFSPPDWSVMAVKKLSLKDSTAAVTQMTNTFHRFGVPMLHLWPPEQK